MFIAKKQSKIQFKELATVARTINLKIKSKKDVSNQDNDEIETLEKGYASARAGMFEYQFE